MAQVQFYKPSSRAEIDRRKKLATALLEKGKQPDRTEFVSGYAVQQSPLSGLAKALTTGLGGFQEAKAAELEQQKADIARQTMADALAGYNRSQEGGQTALQNGESISWNKASPDQAGAIFANALMQNEDTAPFAMQAQMAQMQAKQNAAQELEQFKAMMPLQVDLARQRAAAEAQYRAPTQAPAPLQVANAYLEAVQSGDLERANAIREFAKTQEKGTYTSPTGEISPLPGIENTLSAMSQAKQTGQNISDLAYKPKISRESAVQTEIGKRQGEAAGNLVSLEAAMPKLEAVTQKLSALGKEATYTQAGQLKDATMRQLGQPVGPGAVARTEYMSTIDNEVLPLLRDTFGAQFTQKEGESLKATLGDVNKSPEEKDAALRSFIAAKAGQVETLKRQTGQKIRVSNGSEVLEIDPSDLQDAQAEGFNPL